MCYNMRQSRCLATFSFLKINLVSHILHMCEPTQWVAPTFLEVPVSSESPQSQGPGKKDGRSTLFAIFVMFRIFVLLKLGRYFDRLYLRLIGHKSSGMGMPMGMAWQKHICHIFHWRGRRRSRIYSDWITAKFYAAWFKAKFTLIELRGLMLKDQDKRSPVGSSLQP